MPILPSAGTRIQELLLRLESPVAAERESAVARLTLLGARTIPHLQEFLTKAKAPGRLAALDVLDGLGDPRALTCVLSLTQDASEGVALRAVEIAAVFPEPRAADALRAVLSSRSGTRRQAAARSLGRLHRLGQVEAVSPLLGLVLDHSEEEMLRLEVLESLSSLDRRTLLPALETLSSDRSPTLALAARDLMSRFAGTKSAKPAAAAPAAAVEADIPTLLSRLESARTSAADAATIVETLVKQRSPALLPILGRRLEALDTDAVARGDEATARSKARVHLALGALGSRIALHDLREMLKARPLYAARDLLAAADLVGDASLVPALAALAADEPRLVSAAATAFQVIVRRENLRRTSRVVKALAPRHKAALESLWPTQRAGSGEANRDLNRKLR